MRKGFTLIELLVVIAIIGIVSSVTLSFLAGKIRGKNSAMDQQEERQDCEKKGKYRSVSDLPAVCLKYFTGQTAER